MKICKNFTVLLYAFLILSLLPAEGTQSGHIEYNSETLDYSKLNFKEIKKDADMYFVLFEESRNNRRKKKYLEIAQNKYYILTKIDPTEITPYVQLGRIYDTTNKPKLAKEYFFKATNLNADDPFANFYFGEFYFYRRDYQKALNYYNRAYNNGLNNRYDLNLKLATIYEKLADLINAKKFYEISYTIKPDASLQQKIQQLYKLNYDKSEYYHFIRE